MIESGARSAEIGLCYFVRRGRDFTAWCKKGNFAIYGETEPENHRARLPLVTFE